MTLEIIKRIDTTKLAQWLETLKPRLKPDVSVYAKGRLRCWLGVEPSLTRVVTERPGVEVSPKIINRLTEIIEWRFDYCLVTFSAEAAIGITPHRDASFADREARGLNVTGYCQFSYSSPGVTETVMLEPGDLIKFDCKNVHGAVPNSNRWGMNFWRKKA